MEGCEKERMRRRRKWTGELEVTTIKWNGKVGSMQKEFAREVLERVAGMASELNRGIIVPTHTSPEKKNARARHARRDKAVSCGEVLLPRFSLVLRWFLAHVLTFRIVNCFVQRHQ